MPVRQPRVFTIPSGAPFLPTLSRALLDGVLVDGFPGAGGAMALIDATIYVPTQRAAQALAKALLSASGARSLILPRIAPLGAFEPDEAATFFASRAGRGPASGAARRSRSVDAPSCARAPHARLGAGAARRDPRGRRRWAAHRRSLRAGAGRCDASPGLRARGRSCRADRRHDHRGRALGKLETLAPDFYDSYWRITLDFLKIAFAHWPEWLAERGLIDRAKRVALLIENEIKALADGARRGPTIIAGSTGANRATARLIAAIARAPQGAVVLPDLDRDLDERAWAMIGASDDASQGLAGHPQALLHRLTAMIGVRRDDVAILGSLSPAARARSAFLSEALRPAESTDCWRDRERALSPPAVAAALEGVTVVIADNENEEALALAIAMRETLETQGKTAALVTPDPSIARRVKAELARWGVEVEDSAGRTLGQSPAGALARLILQAAIEFTPRSFLALLAHPLARFGRARADAEGAARALELAIFRAIPLASLDDLDQAFAAAREAAANPRAHPAIRRIGKAGRLAGEALARDVANALAPLRALPPTASLRDCLALHRIAVSAALARPEQAGNDASGFEPLTELMEEWAEAAVDAFPCAVSEYASLFDDALAAVRAPPAGRRPPAPADPWPPRSAPPQFRLRASRRASTRPSGRPRSRPTPFSTGRCAPRSAFRRRSGASARPRTILSPRSGRGRRS